MGNRDLFRGHTQRDVRAHNIATILRLIRSHGPLSRSDIVRLTGLSKATVSILVREFEEMEIVEPAGSGQTATGPKPRLLRFNENYLYLIGVDLSDPRLEVGLIDLEGALQVEPYQGDARGAPLPEAVYPGVDRMLEAAREAGKPVCGIGVTISGLVDYRRGIVHESTVHSVTDLPLRDALESRYDMPVRVDGDANVRLLVEQGRDAADWTDRSVVYCHVSTGVGAGILINGEVYRGVSGLVGEIGHIPVVHDGPPCPCGSRGCLEVVASWPALARKAASLGLVPPGGALALSPEDVVEAARRGEEAAKAACREVADHLGRGLASLINLLNPDLLIIGGEIATQADVFEPLIAESVESWALKPTFRQVEMRFAASMEHSGIKGIVGMLFPVVLERLMSMRQFPEV